MALKSKILPVLLLGILSACSRSGGLETPVIAYTALDNPSGYDLTGSGVSVVGGTNYLLADSSGNVNYSSNTIAVLFQDPASPIQISGSGNVFFDETTQNTCQALAPLVASQTDSSGETIETSIGATACGDQAAIELTLDTSQLLDAAGNVGDRYFPIDFTVDNAPTVSVVAVGYNGSTIGTGTPDTPGFFEIASDTSLVVKFSKNMAGGTYSASLTAGINGTGGACTFAALNSQGTLDVTLDPTEDSVYWTLSGTPTAGTCYLNVSNVTDFAGNPDDPSDANISMAVTFR